MTLELSTPFKKVTSRMSDLGMNDLSNESPLERMILGIKLLMSKTSCHEMSDPLA